MYKDSQYEMQWNVRITEPVDECVSIVIDRINESRHILPKVREDAQVQLNITMKKRSHRISNSMWDSILREIEVNRQRTKGTVQCLTN